MHEFGVTGEDLAEVAVTHRCYATLNPDSVMGPRGPLTVEDVVGSRWTDR
jgi:acetyl-CoA C-acetyltransferase